VKTGFALDWRRKAMMSVIAISRQRTCLIRGTNGSAGKVAHFSRPLREMGICAARSPIAWEHPPHSRRPSRIGPLPAPTQTVVIPTPERSETGGICCLPLAPSAIARTRQKTPCHSDARAERDRRNLLSSSTPTAAAPPCHSEPAPFAAEESASLTRITAGSPHPSAKSSQVGFPSSIKATFFSRRHPLISVSRAIASPTFRNDAK